MINLCRKPLINTSAGLFSARPSQNVVAWPSQQLMRSWRTRRIDLPSNGARGLGKDTVGTWIDLASFVSSSGSGHSPYEELADKIGRDVYLDVAGWHLYLKDVKVGGSINLAQGLAQQLGSQIDGQGFREADMQALLKKIPIKLGQGKVTVSLGEVVPAACVRDLEDICEEYARRR